MSKWFEIWFDSPYYHKLYAHRDDDEAKRFIDKLFNHYGWNNAMEVLDLCCGSGRYTQVLTDMGHQVTGLDLSKESIKIARERHLDHARFVVGDMRDFRLNQTFNLILNLFTSFGYFESREDNELVVANIRRHLQDEGTVVIDYLNPQYVIDNLVAEETVSHRDTAFLIRREVNPTHVIKTISVEGSDEVFEEKVQLINPNEFEGMLRKSGFSQFDLYGDYELNSWSEQSPRQIIVATQ